MLFLCMSDQVTIQMDKPEKLFGVHYVDYGLFLGIYGPKMGCTLCPFWSGIGCGFQRNYGSIL